MQLANQLVTASIELERTNYTLERINPASQSSCKSWSSHGMHCIKLRLTLYRPALMMTDINLRMSLAREKISALPSTEQELLSFQREYEIAEVNTRCC